MSVAAANVVLRDGATVGVRPICDSDEPAMVAFLQGLSLHSRTLRFFSAATNLDGQAARAVNVDGADAFGLIATAGADEQVVGHAGYVREDRSSAEVAFAIAEAYQGHGLATTLLAHLAAHARENDIVTFTAVVLPENHRMIDVFRESGFPVEVRAHPDVISITLPTELSAEGWERFHHREQIGSVAAVRCVLAPHSVAVIGASRRRETMGGRALHNLIAGDFQGALYAVNAAASEVQGMPAYASVGDLPAPLDLAIIAVPAPSVVQVARECGAAGARSLVVMSAGFAEIGAAGAERQDELLAVCRAHGMRLVGPNCLGVLNTAATVRLNATFMPRRPEPGGAGFLSQSGGLGIAVVDAASRLGLGLSTFVSVGNKADLSGNDFIQYWEQDPATEVILMYLESFGNARKFARVARQAGRTKPVAVVKAGRSGAGARRAASAAFQAAPDVTVDALFRQAGVIRTDTLGELLDVATLLSAGPAPRGARVAILTNAAGPGVLCADACDASGLALAVLPRGPRARLKRFLRRGAPVGDALEMVAAASADDYAHALDVVGRAGVADAIIAIFVPTLVAAATDVAEAISSAAENLPSEVVVAAVFMVDGDTDVVLRRSGRPIPVYPFPENAARALGHAARYGAWREAPLGDVVHFEDCRPDAAAALIARALGQGGEWLPAADVTRLLECYGVCQPPAGEHGSGVDLLVGVAQDRALGPLIACGAGGPAAELLGDVAVRLTPLSESDACEMVRSLRLFPLLAGDRASTRCDLASLEGLLLRVGALVEAHPEVAEVDLNPVVVSPDGTFVAGARIRLERQLRAATLPSLA